MLRRSWMAKTRGWTPIRWEQGDFRLVCVWKVLHRSNTNLTHTTTTKNSPSADGSPLSNRFGTRCCFLRWRSGSAETKTVRNTLHLTDTSSLRTGSPLCVCVWGCSTISPRDFHRVDFYREISYGFRQFSSHEAVHRSSRTEENAQKSRHFDCSLKLVFICV